MGAAFSFIWGLGTIERLAILRRLLPLCLCLSFNTSEPEPEEGGGAQTNTIVLERPNKGLGVTPDEVKRLTRQQPRRLNLPLTFRGPLLHRLRPSKWLQRERGAALMSLFSFGISRRFDLGKAGSGSTIEVSWE